MSAFTAGAPNRARVILPILAAPAVWELEGPIITGPRISNTFMIFRLSVILYQYYLSGYDKLCPCSPDPAFHLRGDAGVCDDGIDLLKGTIFDQDGLSELGGVRQDNGTGGRTVHLILYPYLAQPLVRTSDDRVNACHGHEHDVDMNAFQRGGEFIDQGILESEYRL